MEDFAKKNRWFLSDIKERKYCIKNTGCFCHISEAEDITHKKQVVHIGDGRHYKVKTDCLCLISKAEDISQKKQMVLSDIGDGRHYKVKKV